MALPLPLEKTEVKEGTLVIRDLSPLVSGYYKCVATNDFGITNAIMNLVVQQRQLPVGLYVYREPRLTERQLS